MCRFIQHLICATLHTPDAPRPRKSQRRQQWLSSWPGEPGATGKAGCTILGMACCNEWKKRNQRQAVFLCCLKNNTMRPAKVKRELEGGKLISLRHPNGRRRRWAGGKKAFIGEDALGGRETENSHPDWQLTVFRLLFSHRTLL